MSPPLFWLSDRAWTAIEPHLPSNQTGGPRADDRRIISGIIHVLRCGGGWSHCPTEYGPFSTVYNRWNKWSRRGIWSRIVSAISQEDWAAETGAIDSNYIKAYRKAGQARVTRDPLPLASRVSPRRRR
jgi:transposase